MYVYMYIVYILYATQGKKWNFATPKSPNQILCIPPK